MPKFPWQTTTTPNNINNNNIKALQPGDTIAVIGASGNVGKLVALRLSDTFRVNGIVRDASSIESFFEGRKDRINLYEANLLDEMKEMTSGGISSSSNSMTKIESMESTSTTYSPSLVKALENANALVICTGTTAFPTKAWSKSSNMEGDTKAQPQDKDDDSNNNISKYVIQALWENGFSIPKAIASLDEQGWNTPNNVDFKANEFILEAWNSACKAKNHRKQKRVIMLSSIGVDRREQMPFPILNTCGVLDAKAAGEGVIQKYAQEFGYSYTIVRPGQLFGGPYDNNYYLGTLFQLDKDAATQDVMVDRGDVLLGDTLRSTLAEVTAQICEGDFARDMDFAVVNVKGECPTVDALREKLRGLL